MQTPEQFHDMLLESFPHVFDSHIDAFRYCDPSVQWAIVGELMEWGIEKIEEEEERIMESGRVLWASRPR